LGKALKKQASTSFCEQKEAKKLHFFETTQVKPPRANRSKSFLLLFFKKEVLASLGNL
jgi:hypothetical protein